MILTFCGENYSLLQVTNATSEEMNAIRRAVTEHVNKFIARRKHGWNGEVCLVWWVAPYFYIPAGCWKRIWDLRLPDKQTYRPAYDVQFVDSDKFFNKDITIEDVADFAQSLNPAFDDISDQVSSVHTILRYRMSSLCLSTGYGKTYVCYILAQYTHKVLEGKTLMITPRINLVTQGLHDMTDYMQTIDEDMRLKLYGICGGMQNVHSFDDADLYIGTYQSLSNMPDDMFTNITTVICDEGHTAKALSVKECVSKCKHAQIITAISGTTQYIGGADALTIEQFCGPYVEHAAHTAAEQIEKGRLPKVAMQPVVIQHTDGTAAYKAMLAMERLPLIQGRKCPAELASKYRMLEMRYLWTNQHMHNYILQLSKMLTEQGKNVLIIFKNREPAVTLFELANAAGQKAHLWFGSTPKDVRDDIKAQIEREKGWLLIATDGTMSMGTSINNLHAMIVCMIGHSPHVVLQSVGRMLRKHKDKDDITIVYDIINDFSRIGTCYDLANGNERIKYYKKEQYPVYETQIRQDINY